ncbi:MAG: outer membrane beta-barrel protein [Treponema sp.]|nr:outer membrane beta-barrel protein [Treponema sp.]
MKKVFSILLLLALVSAGAFAQDFALSAGGGALLDYSSNNGMKSGSEYMGMSIFGIGGYGFLDATYAVLDVSFAYGSLTNVEKPTAVPSDQKDAGSQMVLGFSLMGKYPVDMGFATIFPLVGINYNFVLSQKDKDGNKFSDEPGNLWKESDLSQFGILAGVGGDFDISDSLYFRAQALFHLRFPSKYMKDMASLFKLLDSNISATYGMGPRIQLGVGYRF